MRKVMLADVTRMPLRRRGGTRPIARGGFRSKRLDEEQPSSSSESLFNLP